MLVNLKYNNILQSAFGFVVATLPFALVHNLNSIALICLSLVVAFGVFSKKLTMRFNINLLVPIIYFLLIFAFTLVQDGLIGIKGFEKYASFILIPVVFAFVINSHIDIPKLLKTFILANLLALCICYVYAISVYSQNPVPLNKGFIYLTEFLDIHPGYLSLYLNFCIAYLFDLFKGNLRFKFKILYIAIFSFAILHLNTRSGIITLLIIYLLVILDYLLKSKSQITIRVTFTIFLLSIMILLLFSSIPNTLSLGMSLLERNISKAIEYRGEIWNAAFNCFSERMFFGYGVHSAQKYLELQYYIHGFYDGVYKHLNAHNQYFQTILQGGISLFILLSLMLFKLIKAGVVGKRYLNFSFLIGVLMLMTIESILERQHGMVFFLFFYVVITNYDETFD